MVARYDRAVQLSGPRRPTLVIVSGAPGSGKTTLANRLAGELRLPLLTKDGMKETLADVLGAPDLEASRRLGDAAYALLCDVLRSLLSAGLGAIVESNFRRDRSEPELRPFVAASVATLIHCQAAAELLHARYAARTGAPDRHPAHKDILRQADLRLELEGGRFEPLRLEIPILRVDTTDGYRPPLRQIVAFTGAVAA